MWWEVLGIPNYCITLVLLFVNRNGSVAAMKAHLCFTFFCVNRDGKMMQIFPLNFLL